MSLQSGEKLAVNAFDGSASNSQTVQSTERQASVDSGAGLASGLVMGFVLLLVIAIIIFVVCVALKRHVAKINNVTRGVFAGSIIWLVLLVVWAGFFIFSTIPSRIAVFTQPAHLSMSERYDRVDAGASPELMLDGAYESERVGSMVGSTLSIAVDSTSVILIVIFGPKLWRMIREYRGVSNGFSATGKD